MKLPAVAFLLVAVVVGGLAFLQFALDRPGTRPPHVVLIVLDTVRADHVALDPPAPGQRDTTPFLRSLAQEGLVFTHARAAANWTLPSHATLFTGLLPSEHGCHFEHRWLADEAATVAEAMRAKGYATAGFSSNVNVSRVFNLDQGFDAFYETWSDDEVRAGKRPTDALADRLVAWVEARPAQPAFVFANFMDAHLPYDAAPGFEEAFGGAGAALDRAVLAAPDLFDRALAGEVALDASFRAALAERYDAAIRGLDDALARLFARLEADGFLDDAVVIVTSDHGENLGEDGMLDHQGSLAESVLRVPLVVWGRGIPAGRRVTSPVSLARVPRIVQDATRGYFTPPERADPDAPVWTDPVLSERMRPIEVLERLAARRPQVDRTRLERRERALVVPGEPWKLLAAEGGAPELQPLMQAAGGGGLAQGPPEGGPPAGEAAAPDGMLERLKARLDLVLATRRVVRERFSAEAQRGTSEPSDESLAELRRLGYASGATVRVSVHAQEHVNIGLRAVAAGELGEARRQFEAAAAIAPGFADALFNVALLLDRLPEGETRKADALRAWQAYLDAAYRSPGQDPQSIQHAISRIDALR